MPSLVSRLNLTRAEGRRSNIVWLVLISAGLAVMALPFASYVAALPLIKTEWGLNNTQAGVIYSAFFAGYALSALVVILLTDRFGPKPVFLSPRSCPSSCTLCSRGSATASSPPHLSVRSRASAW
jgi:MFS family permease